MINNVYIGIKGDLIIVVSTSCDAYLRVTQDKALIYEHPVSPETNPEICWVNIPKIDQGLDIALISEQTVIDHIVVNFTPPFLTSSQSLMHGRG